jgi:hypothetical protein
MCWPIGKWLLVQGTRRMHSKNVYPVLVIEIAKIKA